MTIKSKTLAITAGSILAFAVSANAQNTANVPRDLMLTFQDPGGANASVVLSATAGTTNSAASGGALANAFRDATPGTAVQLTNIGSALSAAFGASWASDTHLFMAALTNTGTSSSVTTIVSGDAQRTGYFTRPRTDVGTIGLQNSPGFTNANSSFYTSLSGNGIATLKTQFEQQPGAGSFPTYQTTTSASSIDDLLPTSAAGVQSAAFGVVTGGVQGSFAPGTFGNFGTVGSVNIGNVELALDLFRMQPGFTDGGANPNIGSEPLKDQVTGITQYLGTLTIDSTGQVDFIAPAAPVPEPGTFLVGLLTAGFAATHRRRRKVVA
jgi:hypothetical protein